MRSLSAGSEEGASTPGMLQGITPSARIAGILILIVAASLSRSAAMLWALIIFTAVITALSGVRPLVLAKRVFPAFIFTAVIMIPVFFDPFTPGRTVLGFSTERFTLSMTEEGIRTGLFFIARAVLMVTLAALMMLTTRQADFFRGLKRFPIPAIFTTALFMTFRYIFILLKTAEESSLARRARTIDARRLKDARQWFASRAAFFLRRSLKTADDVFMAMQSRGFDGHVRVLGGAGVRGRDYLWIGVSSFVMFLSLML